MELQADYPTDRTTLRYTAIVNHEQALIAAFVKRGKRERYRELLSDSRQRRKFLSKLAHFTDFDVKYRLPIPCGKLSVKEIAKQLQQRGSPTNVFVISESSTLDQKDLPLMEALQEIVGYGMGSVISCIPGKLAFIETEDERFILERHDPLQKQEYVRFIITRERNSNPSEQGVIHAAILALEWNEIAGSDTEELRRLFAWFDVHLKGPISSGRDKRRRGVSWFKTSSTEHLSRIADICKILERNGFLTKRISTDAPGYLIYEDEYQIVAEPF